MSKTTHSPLLELLNGFIIELRSAGLPVSLTENLDAVEAVKHIELEDRETFKYALAATLVKNHSHWKAFETVFEVYFSLRGQEYELTDDEWPDDTRSSEEEQGQQSGQMPGQGGSQEGLTQEQLAEMSALLAEPDAATLVEISNSTTENMSRTLDAAEKTRDLIDQAEGLQATVAGLAVEVETLQQQVIALLNNQQMMLNGSFESYRQELERLRDDTNAATVEVGALNTAAQDNREVIEQAANIRQEAVNIAEREARRAMSEWRDEFLDLMALSVRALGLTETDLIRTANTMEIEPANSSAIRRSSIERFIQISRATNNTVEAAKGEVRD